MNRICHLPAEIESIEQSVFVHMMCSFFTFPQNPVLVLIRCFGIVENLIKTLESGIQALFRI